MAHTNKRKRAKKRVLALILTLSLLVTMAIPVQAADSPAPEATALNALIAEAAAIDLNEYPAQYADPVAHMLNKAENAVASPAATAEQLNLARLELQVALDTLVVDLQKATIPELQALVKAGELTYTGLTQMYLTRIELYNDNANKLNAVRALNPNALAEAEACDTAFAQDSSVAEGMFGITVMLKDNINFMGLPTTAGSIALADNYAPYDAPLVTNLKNAGAIILGKLNMTEFAHGVSNNGTNVNGFSSLGRRVYSAYRPLALGATGTNLNRLDPSGSSSGSAVAASAALAAVTIGTETNGSIISPSQSNFLVGIKPTVGLISRYGVIPLNILQDTAGPMTRNVTDAAFLLNGTYGYDPNDSETDGIAQAGLTGFDFSQCLEPGFLQDKRIGVMSMPGATAAARPAFEAALQALEDAGATLVYQENGSVLPSISNPSAPSSTTFQFKMSLPLYLETLDPSYKWANKTTDDMYAYYQELWNSTTPAGALFRDELGTALDINKIGQSAGYTLDEETLATWAAHRESDLRQCRDEGIDKRLADYNLDGLVGSGSLTALTARGCYPHITLPIYRTDGAQLTGGSHMYFAGTAYSEPVLVAAAYVAEQATKARDNSAPGLADKTSLGKAITYARTVLTAEQRAEFQAVYDAAVSTGGIYRNDFATQMEVDKFDAELRAAILNAQPADKAALNHTVAFAQKLNALYLSGTVKGTFETLLANAAATGANELALQSEVDAAQAALNNLLCSTAFLQAFVDFASIVEEYLSQYPEEGKAAFLQALTDAREVLNDSTASPEQYLAAVEALNDALAVLEPGTNILAMEVTTDAFLVKQGDFYHVDSRFTEEVRTNAVILTYTFDSSKLLYEGFTPANGITVIEEAVTGGTVKLTVMISGYNAEDLGQALFRAKEDAVLENEDNQVKAMLSCAVKDENGEKQIYKARGSVFFTTTKGLGEVTLVDLSNLIDIFGADSTHALWSQYRFHDFNNSSTIDIYDIAYVASLLVE